jgi:ribosomal protein S27E
MQRSLIDVDKMEFIPTKDQIAHWESNTGTSFALSLGDSETTNISCPKCFASINVPYVNNKGTGFGQSDFSVPCAECGLTVSRDSLCVGKFLGDISKPDALLAWVFP